MIRVKFTSFVAFEWSATPDYSHTHRNVIFASDKAVPDAIDYMRYPTAPPIVDRAGPSVPG